eukprot:m.3443 g.3443  ORF g.3443 m.3443 type:complete len:201 (+) comp2070_c0_seq1:82-684(+)
MTWTLKGLFDLEKQIGFYAQYHHNIVNFCIHVVGVPCILWSAMVMFSNWFQFPDITPQPIFDLHAMCGVENMPFTGASAAWLIYSLGYIVMDPVAGVLASALLAIGSMTAFYFQATNENAMMIATIVHVVGWIVQFYGHFVHEGRAPALFDNLFQSVYLAPFFVLLEVMFQFGYRKDLSKKIYDNAERDITAWKASKKQK